MTMLKRAGADVDVARASDVIESATTRARE
jgi:hypothetical protein